MAVILLVQQTGIHSTEPDAADVNARHWQSQGFLPGCTMPWPRILLCAWRNRRPELGTVLLKLCLCLGGVPGPAGAATRGFTPYTNRAER